MLPSLIAKEKMSLPARASEQGNVIGSVSVYICDRLWENGAFGENLET